MGILDRLGKQPNKGEPAAGDQLSQLKAKYASVLRFIEQKGIRLQNVHVEGGKLVIRGSAPSQELADLVWDQVKLVDPNYGDLTLDLSVASQSGTGGSGTAAAMQTHTVVAGDTLSKLAQRFYGDKMAYQRIFDANRDILKDPDLIHPGQVLKIPAR